MYKLSLFLLLVISFNLISLDSVDRIVIAKELGVEFHWIKLDVNTTQKTLEDIVIENSKNKTRYRIDPTRMQNIMLQLFPKRVADRMIAKRMKIIKE